MNIGDRIYYTGDMANPSAWLTITKLRSPGVWDMREGGDDGRDFRGIFEHQIGTEYHGHCGTRFVTEAAYIAHRDAAIAQMKRSIQR